MKPTRKRTVRPTLRSVLGRGHLSVALLAVGLAGISSPCWACSPCVSMPTITCS